MPITDGMITLAVLAAASALQAGTGFGFAMLAIPVLSMSVNPVDAIAIVALAGGVMTGQASYRDRKFIDVPIATRFCVSSLLGLPLGMLLLLLMSEAMLTAVIGVVVLLSVAAVHSGLRFPDSPRTHWGAGALSGAMMTSTGINGPPIVLTLHATGMAARPFRGVLSVAFTFQRAVTLLLFLMAGTLTSEALWLSLAGIPAILLGWEAGNRVFHRLNAERFTQIVEVLLVISAVICLVRAALQFQG